MIADISIHPPRGGWDFQIPLVTPIASISIHPPRGGWDHFPLSFQSVKMDFNPPTPWGGGTGATEGSYNIGGISIHPPRGGWDSP